MAVAGVQALHHCLVWVLSGTLVLLEEDERHKLKEGVTAFSSARRGRAFTSIPRRSPAFMQPHPFTRSLSVGHAVVPAAQVRRV